MKEVIIFMLVCDGAAHDGGNGRTVAAAARAEVAAVLAQAAALPKPCGCTEYERLKTRLRLCRLNCEEYERALQALCRALGV